MSEILNFKFDFIARSQKLLLANWDDLSKQDLEITTLLNCTISLLCLIVASTEEDNYQVERLNDFIKDKEFYFKSFPFDIPENQILSHEQRLLTELVSVQSVPEYTSVSFIKKLRNSLAHGNIKPINALKNWKIIRVWNRKQNSAKTIDFVFEIDTSNLLAFYNSLADFYSTSLSN